MGAGGREGDRETKREYYRNRRNTLMTSRRRASYQPMDAGTSGSQKLGKEYPPLDSLERK